MLSNTNKIFLSICNATSVQSVELPFCRLFAASLFSTQRDARDSVNKASAKREARGWGCEASEARERKKFYFFAHLPPAPSRLSYCAGVQFARRSFPAFND